MPRDRMGSAQNEQGQEIRCSNGHSWPPALLLIYDDLEEIREEAGDLEYQKAKVWENACGLRRVSLDKCPACPYVLVDGVKVNGRKPAPNQATRATVPASKRGKER